MKGEVKCKGCGNTILLTESQDVRLEAERLRAEVAALREEMRVLDGNAGTLHDALQDLQRELEQARALLAEGADGGNENCGCIFTKPEKCWMCRTRAFLAGRRDEAPRCTCSYGWNGPGPHSDGCEWEPRDEGPRCTCDLKMDVCDFHSPYCGPRKARDEGSSSSSASSKPPHR